MLASAKKLLFILFIPFLAAMSHDVYFNYFSDSEKVRQIKRLQINSEEFMVSDLGWVWSTYHSTSMEMARTMVETATWKAQVDPILQLPSMVVGLIPLVLGCIFMIFAFALGVWPFSKYGRARKENEDDYAVYKHAQKKSIKFTKK